MASRIGAPINVTFGASFTVPAGANAFVASGIYYDGASQAVTALSGSRISGLTGSLEAVASTDYMGVWSYAGVVNSSGTDTWSLTKSGFFSEGPTCQVQFYSVADNSAVANFVRQRHTVGNQTHPAISRSVSSTTSDLIDAWIMSDGGGTVSGAITDFTAVGTEQTVNADKSRVFQATSPGASSTSITGPNNAYPGLVIVSIFDNAGGGGTDYTLTADAGSYALTGVAAALRRGYTLVGAAGSYAITGGDATLRRGYRITADAGSYAITGGDAVLRRGYSMSLDPGSYSITGSDATLTYSAGGTAYTLVCDAGSYSTGGGDATLTYTPGPTNYTLICEAGSYATTGVAAGLTFARRMALDAGSYSITGSAAGLTYGRRLVADAGSYAFGGGDADLIYTTTGPIAYTLTCEAGSYLTGGGDAGLTYTDGSAPTKVHGFALTKHDSALWWKRKPKTLPKPVAEKRLAKVVNALDKVAARAVEQGEQPKRRDVRAEIAPLLAEMPGFDWRPLFAEILQVYQAQEAGRLAALEVARIRAQAQDDEDVLILLMSL